MVTWNLNLSSVIIFNFYNMLKITYVVILTWSIVMQFK